ncbi:MAG TPA: EcsC family protein [Nevskiaceae bacterium]|nr:EcsC family protein [Nevskiaceae bacterium]
MALTAYELDQLRRLREWQAAPPPPVARWMGRASGPASRAIQNALPTAWLAGVLAQVQKTSRRLDGRDRLLRAAGVRRIEDLQTGPLEHCDALARRVQQRAAALAGGTGAVLGVAGAAGLVADVPALLLQAFRVIHRTGLCYGWPPEHPQAGALSLAVFALASANSVEEKQSGLEALDRTPADALAAAWRDGLERAAERELAKELATGSLNNLALQLARHLGWRKAAASAPLVGAVVGGSVNAWYVWDVAATARYCHQARWLRERHGAAALPEQASEALAAPG